MVNFIAVVHPVVPPTTETALESAPDLPVDVLPAPPQIGPSRLQPAKPHLPAPVATEPAAAKHVEPMITPELTTEEMASAQRETQHSLDTAEKNLTLAHGKKLNAMQADLASKVKGFADNAREAARAGDWTRAKNLSKKAEVLSEQLAASF